MNIIELTEDLLAPSFGEPSWDSWRTALAALFGLPLPDPDLYSQCTGRSSPPTSPATEGWFCVGRRGGKSQIAALIAVYLSLFREYKLSAGETPVFMIIAADRRQARVTKRYVSGLLLSHPLLKKQIYNETKGRIELYNDVAIEIHTGTFRAVRGHTVIGAVCDEIAFWRTDEGSANPDSEVLNALRPAMATVPGSLLVAISSPYARRGELYRAYRDHYSKDSEVLVWKANTQTMNPNVPERIIKRAYTEDAARASAEYGAEFRTDVESLISREVVEAAVELGCYERAPLANCSYIAFVDPSGGSSDSMTLAIAHRESNVAVLDVIRERKPPFSPEAVVTEFADTLKRYRVSKVIGDRYAGEWPRERFAVHGVRYEPSTRSKSDLYRDLLPVLNSREAILLDYPRLVSQFVGLERRTARGGRDSIDHAPGGHDDVANAVAGALLLQEKASRGAVW